MSPALEVTGLGRAAFALVANGDPYTYVGRVPAARGPRTRASSWASTSSARASLAGAPYLGSSPTSRRRRPARGRMSYTATTSTPSRSSATQPTPLQVDGEDLGDVDRAVFECESDAISGACRASVTNLADDGGQ